METGREVRQRQAFTVLVAALLAAMGCDAPAPTPSDIPGAGGLAPTPETRKVGQRGGRLVAALTAEPKTLNPAVARDITSRTVIRRLTADLIRIDRDSQEATPALAERWTVSPDGRTYTLELRKGLRFSDGHPCDADDVVFSFRVYLDEAVSSPGRDQLLNQGTPLSVRKLDLHTVEFELTEPYAAAERIFDGFPILPQHRLETSYQAGRLNDAWALGTPPEEIVGLGPFKIQDYRPGERLILERNPYYWKLDADGQQLPYLDQLIFLFLADQDAQVVRFQAGDIDVIDRLTAGSFSLLERESERRNYRLYDLGSGLDYNFLFFNLNDLSGKNLAQVEAKQRWFEDVRFRRAILAAIDLNGIARLVYSGRATSLASHVSPGDKHWIHPNLPPPTRSLQRARQLLQEIGFRWADDGTLLDANGQRGELSLLTAAGSSQRGRIAAVIQDDLRQLGLEVQIVALGRAAFLERVLKTHDFEACLLGLGGGVTGPNPAVSVLSTGGSHHLWRLGQAEPATPWEAEIDRLMRLQKHTLESRERRRMYHRVQEIVADQLPMISLVSPNVLVGAKTQLGNFRPAVLDHSTLWNVDELFWN